MSWSNIHKWVVRYSDDPKPNFEVLKNYSLVVSIAEVTDTGCSVLHLAALGEESALALFLVDFVPEFLINQNNDYGESPLHWACQAGNIDIVRAYLKAGAYVNCRDTDKNTPLHYAAKAGHVHIIKELFKHKRKPRIDAHNYEAKTALGVACEEQNLKAIKFLVKIGANYHDLLCDAVQENDKFTVRALVKASKSQPKEANVNLEQNPLHLAVIHNQFKIAKILCNVEAWIHGKNKHGKTPADLVGSSSDKRLKELFANNL